MKPDPSLPYLAPNSGFVNRNRRVHLPDLRGIEPMREGEERYWRSTVRRELRNTKLRPNDAFAFSMLALARRRLMRLETALRDLHRAIERRSDWAFLYFDRGNTRFDLHRYQEAIQDYEQAIDRGYGLDAGERWRNQTRAVAFFNRGLSFNNLDRPEEAILEYGRALDLHPEYADALNNRGNLLNDLGRHEEALADFDRGVALAPHDSLMHANQANVLLRLGRIEEALTACDRALAINPKEPVALYNKACALARRGDADEAARWLAEAIQKDPQNRKDAWTDPDFDAIRKHPEMATLLG